MSMRDDNVSNSEYISLDVKSYHNLRGRYLKRVWLCLLKCAVVFCTGGIVYHTLELLWRGHSHPSMIICGGLCLLVLYHIENNLRIPMLFKALLGAIAITEIEFFTGLVVNVALDMKVWDYSYTPYNLLGQICLPFSVLWFLLSLPAFAVCRAMEKHVFSGIV